MSGEGGLEVHTEWIRRAADSLDQAARDFRAGQGAAQVTGLGMSVLGDSVDAVDTARCVTSRLTQSQDAADQLTAVSAGLAQRLRAVAAQFERYESAISLGAR